MAYKPPNGEANPFLDDDKVAKIKSKHGCLRGLHMCGVLTVQIIVVSVLFAFILWLFLRIPEPEVVVESFSVDQLNHTKVTTTNLHYVVTLHNPDIYKSIHYDLLQMRITYSLYSTSNGITVDFGKDIHQGPGDKKKFSNTSYYGNSSPDTLLSFPYTYWIPDELTLLKTQPEMSYLTLDFVMQFKVLGVTRQRMRTADLYFDYKGDAFITHHIGLRLM